MSFKIKNVVLIKYIAEDGETSVTIPDNVTIIFDSAFSWCENLTEVKIPNSVKSIGKEVFYKCKNLTEVKIPDSVTSIGDRAFCECKSLERVTIGNSVTSIGYRTFYECENLKEIKIPDSVTSIGKEVFYKCENLTEVTIPNAVTSIGDSAFSGCKSLKAVKIPDAVTSIGWRAFLECENLEEVTIPDSVTSIDDWAFCKCKSLTEIKVSENNTAYSDIDGVLFNKEKTELLCYPGGKSENSYIIPDSVTSIGEYAFDGCTRLKEVIIPDSVTSIGDSAFAWCESLKEVKISDSVTSISGWAFENCKNLTKIKVSKNNTAYSDVNGVLFNKEKTEMLYIPECKKSLTLPAVYTVSEEVSFENITSVKFANGNTFKVSSKDCHKVNESKSDAWNMLLKNDFSMKFSHKLKYKLIIDYYLASDNEAAEAYIKKNALKIFRWLIDEEDIPTIYALINTHKFVTAKNIDKIFEHANQKNNAELKLIFMNYKHEHIGMTKKKELKI